MKISSLLLSCASLVFAAETASAVEVKKSLPVQGEPEAIWKIANAFCSIKDWHPDFSGCSSR